ncbi:leucine zipper domain-containing protein [Enterobacter intestinihominis]
MPCRYGFFSALWRLFGICRKTGYKWLQRFDPSDLSSLSDRSRGPETPSRPWVL